MELVDTHAHLDDKRFSTDIDDVIEKAKAKESIKNYKCRD